MDTVNIFSEAMLHFNKFGDLIKELQSKSTSAVDIHDTIVSQKKKISELQETVDAKAKECSELTLQLFNTDSNVQLLEDMVKLLSQQIASHKKEVEDLKEQVDFYESAATKATQEAAAIELRYNLQKEISTKQKDTLEELHTAKRKRDGVVDVLPTLQDVTYDHVLLLDSGRLSTKHSSEHVLKTRFSLRIVEKSRSSNKGSFKVYYLKDGDAPSVYCRSMKHVVNMMKASLDSSVEMTVDAEA